MEIYKEKWETAKGNEATSIEANFDNSGNLVISGADIGPSVETYWGDIDYEYFLSVYKKDMEKLFLLLLKESFNSKEALDFTKIKKICEANEIKAIFDYWI